MPIPSENDTYQRITAKERVYRALRQWIMNGTLEPGERLSDADIAKHFNVSRTPVREALQLLVEQKLVSVLPSSGTFVSEIDIEELQKVYEALGALQADAMRLGFEKITDKQLEDLDYLNDTFRHFAEKGDAEAVMKADWDFHHSLAMLSGNSCIVAFTDQLMLQAHRNEIRFFRKNTYTDESFGAHRRITEALRRKDLAAASAAVSENWQISVSQKTL